MQCVVRDLNLLFLGKNKQKFLSLLAQQFVKDVYIHTNINTYIHT